MPLPERALQEGGAPLHHGDQAITRLEARPRPRPRPRHAHRPPEHRQHGGGWGRHCHTLCIACINYHCRQWQKRLNYIGDNFIFTAQQLTKIVKYAYLD